MQQHTILQKFQDINSYGEPNNIVVKGILSCNENIVGILRELREMLEDNYSKTESILGEELTRIVLINGKKSN